MTRTVDVDGTEQEVTGLPWEVGINSNEGEWMFLCPDTKVQCSNVAGPTPLLHDAETRCPREEEAQAFCQAPCDTFCTENAFTTLNNEDVMPMEHNRIYAMGSTVSSCDSRAARFDEDFTSTMAKATAFFEGARDTLSAKGPLATAVCDRARPRYNPYRP